MKKLTIVKSLAVLATIAAFSSCSSAPSDGTTSEEPSAPVEASANNEAFNSLVNNDPAASPGAVADQSSPVLVADAGNSAASALQHPVVESAPTSPVNLGASSAGRAH